MKLIIAIIHDDLINNIIKSLTEHKHRATKLSSTGGFLKSGNTTLLIGVEDNKVDDVVDLIRQQCKHKKRTQNKDEVEISGANLFILDMQGYHKI